MVLDSFAGRFLQDSLDILAPLGRFVEIGKRDIMAGSRMSMAALEHNVSMTVVDLVGLMQFRPAEVADVLHRVNGMVVAGILRPVSPLRVYSASNIEEAFRQLQSRSFGKIAVSFSTNQMVKVSHSSIHGHARHVDYLGSSSLLLQFGPSCSRWHICGSRWPGRTG